MTNTKWINLLFIMLFLQACHHEDLCDECFTPPQPLVFEVVDKTSGENLFKNGTYQSGELKVVDLVDDSDVDFDFIAENDLDLIQINSIGWKTETVNFSFSISGENVFTLHVDAEREMDQCCSFTNYNEVVIENAEFEYNSNTGIYKVFLE